MNFAPQDSSHRVQRTMAQHHARRMDEMKPLPHTDDGKQIKTVLLLFALTALVVFLLLAGCREYSYKSPEGSEMKISIPALSNANLGKVRAGRRMADGSEVYIEVENYSNEEHYTQFMTSVTTTAIQAAMKGVAP